MRQTAFMGIVWSEHNNISRLLLSSLDNISERTFWFDVIQVSTLIQQTFLIPTRVHSFMPFIVRFTSVYSLSPTISQYINWLVWYFVYLPTNGVELEYFLCHVLLPVVSVDHCVDLECHLIWLAPFLYPQERLDVVNTILVPPYFNVGLLVETVAWYSKNVQVVPWVIRPM